MVEIEAGIEIMLSTPHTHIRDMTWENGGNGTVMTWKKPSQQKTSA